MARFFTDKNGKKHPLTTKKSRYKESSMGVVRKSFTITDKATRFIADAIRERRREHPEESHKQSVAIAYSKARKAGYKVPGPPLGA